MGARELLADLSGAGFSITADGERLVIRPASKLTDPLRAALREAKPELLALLVRGAAHLSLTFSRNVRPYGQSRLGFPHDLGEL